MNKGIKILLILFVSMFVFVKNASAYGLVYGEDIPTGDELLYAYVEDEVIENAYCDLTYDEANNLKITLEESGYTTVTMRSYSVKTGEVTSTENKHFDSYSDALDYITSLEESGIVVSNVSFVNDTSVQDGSLNGTYTSLAEANSALNDFNAEYENVTSNITHNYTEEVLGNTTGTTPYDTESEATEAKDNYIAQHEEDDFYYTGTVVGPKGKGTYTTSSINQTFNSEDAANAFLAELESQGYEILSHSFTHNTEEQSGSLTQTYETEDLANTAAEGFASQYPNNTATSVIKVHDESEDSSRAFNQQFSSENAANEFLNEQLALNSDDVVVTGEVTSSTTAGSSISIGPEVFNTLAEAQARVTELSTQYDVVESSNIETIEAGTVYDAELFTAYESGYEIGNSVFVVVKHGNQLFVWTLNQLSDEEIRIFKQTYKDEFSNVDPAISNVDRASFIYGINNEHLTGNNKIFTIEDRDGVLYAVMAPGSVSHIIYGEFTPVNEYHVTATVHNNVTTWTAAGNVLTKGYDYKLTASGTKTVTLDSGVLTGSKRIEDQGYFFDLVKKAKTHTVIASGTKTITLDSGELTIDKTEDVMEEFYALDLVRQKFEFVGGMGDIEEEDDNPYTADNSIYSLIIGFISLIGLAITSLLKKVTD